MKTVLLMLVTFAGYLIAYHTYGRFLSRRIFRLRGDAATPSEMFHDGMDYVPTRKGIIFGHHYTSIAGTGPIVGPAIGVIWGWVPALIWVFAGSIVMGAVHDFGTIVISLRNQGKSVSECASRYINRRVRAIFFMIIFLLLMIVIAIFGVVIAAIFKMYPQAVFPVWMEIPIAVTLGYLIYKRNWNVTVGTLLAVIAMYVTVVLGHFVPLEMPDLLSGGSVAVPATGLWVVILLVYAFIASSLPVTTLLQPRDYINAWQLFVAMGLLVVGILTAAFTRELDIVAPAFNPEARGAPPLVPFLFITIACGAISGFHALVGSGTTSKQITRETDAQYVGYGSMLMEAVLATLVIITVTAGIGLAYTTTDGVLLQGPAAWNHHYESWQASQGLGSKITAVVVGAANMMETLAVPRHIGIIIMGVFIASFAGTTLDSATRIQRYVIAELAGGEKRPLLSNRYTATTLAVLTAAGLAFATGADGKGALTLWPMFGAVNQLLAALALLVLSNYLKTKGGRGYLVAALPCAFMLVITIWAVILNEINFASKAMAENGGGSMWLLTAINGLVLVLAVWMGIEGVKSFLGQGPDGGNEN